MIRFRRTAIFALLITTFAIADSKPAPKAAPPALPAPESVFGFEPGADYHLADYEQITDFFHKLAAAMPQRVKLENIGKSGYGKEMFVAVITSEENMKQLEHYKDIVHQLASGTIDEATARRLANDGRPIVWIDGGLHATEVAGAQQSPLIGWRVATEDTPEMQRIRRDVILVLCPVINPDGLDIVAHWYQKNFNTPYETAPNIELWNRYVGHDNNRDWYSFNQVESRNVAKLLYYEWLPQIVYNQHQTAPYPARIIVPPYDDPTNPNIPPEVIRGVNLVGSAMAQRFQSEHKSGVISYMNFDTWWNGGMRTAPYYHNMVGILTETAGFLSGYASPGYAAPESLPKNFPNGVSAAEPSTFYPDPWKGGWWRLRDSVDYMVTGDMAILDLASRRKDDWLFDFWKMSHDQVEQGKNGGPFAYLIPPDQHNPTAAADLLFSLQTGGVKIEQTTGPISAGGKEFPAGTIVLRAAQPFRPFIVDLMEPQHYPDLHVSPGGPPKRPYDMTGWTLPLQMGVDVVRVDQPAQIVAKPYEAKEPQHTFAPTQGKLGRVGLYVSWVANMDAGWTEWLFDRYQIPYTVLHDADVRSGNLNGKFDVVVLPDQNANALMHGWQNGGGRGGEGEFAGNSLRAIQRPEYIGGLGLEGALALEKFVEAGGQLVAMGAASDFAINEFGLPVRNVLAGVSSTQFYGPGSLLRIDVDPSLPETHGMQPDSVAFFVNSAAFQIGDTTVPSAPLRYSERRERDTTNQLGEHNGIRVLAVYPRQKPLLSGWLLGEQHLTGRVAAASVPLGKGRVVLIGFRCQFRGQSENTFPLLFNSLVIGGGRAGAASGE
ncbi:MAG TPA: M14 metallopeptidase family protein [Terriglobales bacterium]|nr:M14 metallopeptidase family protein [Terriglobales bacterium]